jgi:hypothetical protein
MKRFLPALLAGALLGFASTASAVLMLTLSGPLNGNTLGPQSTSAPCIIAATQCQQPAGFGFNNFTSSGAIAAYNMSSTSITGTLGDGVIGNPYTVAQIMAVVGSAFSVAIDVNTTSANSEVLQSFFVFINGVVAYVYNGPHNLAPVFQNGNGFGDWSLGVISLAGLAPTDTVRFVASWTGAVDGGESFFLVSSPPTTVPEPATLALFALALLALAALRRRQTK